MLRSAIKAVALALVACSVASAQEAQKWEGKPRTKLEAFLGTSSAVIIRARTEIGTIGAKDAARVLAVTLRNASTAEETKGIVIEVSQPSAGSRSAAKSFVDYDEIAGLIQGIDHVVQVDRKVTGFAHVEATYSTRDDVRVLVFFDRAGRQQAFVKVGAKSTSMEMAELAEFKRLILRAKNHLDNPQAAAAERAAATARAERAAAIARAKRAAAARASSSAKRPAPEPAPSPSPPED